LILPPSDLIRLQYDVVHNDLINDRYPISASFFMCPQSLTSQQAASSSSAAAVPRYRPPRHLDPLAPAPPLSVSSQDDAVLTSTATATDAADSAAQFSAPAVQFTHRPFVNVEGHVYSERVPNPNYSSNDAADAGSKGGAPKSKPRLGSSSPLPYYHQLGAEAHLYLVPASEVAIGHRQRLSALAAAAAGQPAPGTYTAIDGTPLSSYAQASFSTQRGGSVCFRGVVNASAVAAAVNGADAAAATPVSAFFVVPAVLGNTDAEADTLSSQSSPSGSSAKRPGDAFARVSNTTSLSSPASSFSRDAIARSVTQPFTGSGSRARHDVARAGLRLDGDTLIAGLCWSQDTARPPASFSSSPLQSTSLSQSDLSQPETPLTPNSLRQSLQQSLQASSALGAALVENDSVVEGWLGYRGPRFTTIVQAGVVPATGEKDLNVSTVYEAGPLLGVTPDYNSNGGGSGGNGGAGHPAGGSGVVGQGGGRSFQLGYQWRHWGAEHVFSFLHRLVMRRSVYNPLEKSNVVGIHNYLDVGLQIAFDKTQQQLQQQRSVRGGSPVASAGSASNAASLTDSSTSNAGLSAMSLVLAWQANKNVLVKARVRDSDVSLVLGLKAWSVPSSTLALSGRYAFESNKAEVGVRFELENFGKVLHHRQGAEEIARIENKFVGGVEFEKVEERRKREQRM